MSESLRIDFSEPMPLFPLPTCVLLPSVTIPLHVFEHRYRAMMRDVLGDSRLIALASFEGEQWKQDYNGRPPLREHVCLGYIVRDQESEDGRFNILIQGVCRARILREIDHTPYRVALLEPTEQEAPMEIDLADNRRRIESLLDDPLLASLVGVKALRNWLTAEIPTAAMIDLAGVAVCDETEKRYELLVESDAERRARWLERYLADMRDTLRIAERFGAPRGEDDLPLN